MSCDSCPSCVTLERIRRCNGGGGGGGRSGNLIIAPPPVSKCSFSVGRSVVRSVGSPLSSVLRPSSVLSPLRLHSHEIDCNCRTDGRGRDRNVVRAASRTGGRRADGRTDVWTFEESVRLMMCFREMMRIYSLCRNCISALLYFSLTVGEQISKL